MGKPLAGLIRNRQRWPLIAVPTGSYPSESVWPVAMCTIILLKPRTPNVVRLAYVTSRKRNDATLCVAPANAKGSDPSNPVVIASMRTTALVRRDAAGLMMSWFTRLFRVTSMNPTRARNARAAMATELTIATW